MRELATAFMLWCKTYGNSPDIINLKWWLIYRAESDTPAEDVIKHVYTLRSIGDLL